MRIGGIELGCHVLHEAVGRIEVPDKRLVLGDSRLGDLVPLLPLRRRVERLPEACTIDGSIPIQVVVDKKILQGFVELAPPSR